MKYLMYCRKSSEDDTRQAQSIETQLRILDEFVKANGLEVIGKIVENKTAAEDGVRSEFLNLLNKFRAGEADGLLVAHIDRISRNELETGEIIKLFSKGLLKEIRTPVKVYNTIQDILVLDIELAMAAHYSRNLSVRVREGVQTKLNKGEYPGMAPIGYLNKQAKIYPDPKTMPFIKMAYELYSSGGYTLKEIAEVLFEKGFRTKITGQKVHKSVIHRILKDPVYYGAILRNGKVYQGIHKPLVSYNLFQRVQEVFERTTHPQDHKHKFLYRNYLTCAGCGCKLTASFKKGKYRYYYCTNGKRNCPQHLKYLTELDVQKILAKKFANFSLKENLMRLSLRAYADDLRKQCSGQISTSSVLEKHLENISERSTRLLDLYLAKSIDKTTFDTKQGKLTEEELSLKSQIKNTKPVNLETTLEQLETIRLKAVTLSKVFLEGDDKVKSDLLKSVLWNFSIKDKNVLSEQYKLPYDYLKNMHETDDFETWRETVESVCTFCAQTEASSDYWIFSK